MDIFWLNHICDGSNINFLYHNDLTHMSHDNFGDAITLSAPIHGTPSIMGMEPSNAVYSFLEDFSQKHLGQFMQMLVEL